jgi:transposase
MKMEKRWDRGRLRATAKAIVKWFTDVPHARVAMEAGVHSICISEQLQELGHEVIVANVRKLRMMRVASKSPRPVLRRATGLGVPFTNP